MTKTIVEKLNLQKYNQVAILSKPEGSGYLAELTDYDTSLNGAYDLIFAFVLDMASLQELVNRVIEQQHLFAGIKTVFELPFRLCYELDC